MRDLLCTIPACDPHQARGVDVGAPLEEHARGLGVALLCTNHQRRASKLRRTGRVGP